VVVVALEERQLHLEKVLLAVMDTVVEQELLAQQDKVVLEELVFGLDQTVHQVAEEAQVQQVVERQILQVEQVVQD
tara:strand:- start:437 stop:664 length:228 start_codon:yes stop_codon:yes gene_type:complete